MRRDSIFYYLFQTYPTLQLSLEQLEVLTEVFLDFASLDNLVVWLQNLEVSEK